MITPLVSKIIINLLNDDDSFTKNLNKNKANNPIDQINDILSNRSIPVLESKNEIISLNNISKMISAILDSRANSLFDHITLRTLRPRLIPLSLRDNIMNIVNNSRNILNTS
ncbi:hypothetical protein C1645_823244 [Glomus cerebriforme]|uniref:Uncharacterized protein n=1 Tax=Glomus cerebriforme TaxID=658196 RepID=A0A397SY13_9GLOM|nr:hypothetical protein C1645_823244 [Glomus cerebriforme]